MDKLEEAVLLRVILLIRLVSKSYDDDKRFNNKWLFRWLFTGDGFSKIAYGSDVGECHAKGNLLELLDFITR